MPSLASAGAIIPRARTGLRSLLRPPTCPHVTSNGNGLPDSIRAIWENAPLEAGSGEVGGGNWNRVADRQDALIICRTLRGVDENLLANTNGKRAVILSTDVPQDQQVIFTPIRGGGWEIQHIGGGDTFVSSTSTEQFAYSTPRASSTPAVATTLQQGSKVTLRKGESVNITLSGQSPFQWPPSGASR